MKLKGDVNTNLLIGAAIVGGVYLIYKSVTGDISSIFSGVKSIIPGQSQAAQDNQKSYGSNPAWNPDYWKQYGNPPGGGKLLYWNQIIPVMQAFVDNLGFWVCHLLPVDEAQVMGALRIIKNKAQFSQLVDLYLQNYKKDLFQELNSCWSAKTLNTVVQYVNSLPS